MMKIGMAYVMIANIICLILSVLTNFLLPKFLTVESYALIRTYTLYISYAGFFSLGYNDGMYLKYGGKAITGISQSDLGSNIRNYTLLEILMTLVILSVGVIIKDQVVVAFAIGMFATNMLGYIKSLYQATGEFKFYSSALNIEKFSIFIVNLVMIFLLKMDEYLFYIWAQVLTSIVIVCWLLWKLEKKHDFFKYGKLQFKEFKENISSGFILMLGNFSSSIFTGLDRWFVKVLMNATCFAMYSFAVSLESAITVFMTPITVALYNYFCKDITHKMIIRVKKLVLIWGFIVIAAAFPVKWILEVFLTKYISSNSIIFLLFAAQAFYAIIKGIYVNIYKAEHKQNKYLVQMITMTVLAFLLNVLLYLVYKNMFGIALGTFITSIIWFFICENGMSEIKYSIKEYVAIVIMVITYLACGYYLSAIVGMVVYLIIGLLTLLIFMRDSFDDLLIIIRDTIAKKNT